MSLVDMTVGFGFPTAKSILVFVRVVNGTNQSILFGLLLVTENSFRSWFTQLFVKSLGC